MEKLIIKLKQALEQYQEIEFALLYGSYAKNKVTPLSDIDVALFIKKGLIQNEQKIISFLTIIEKEIAFITESDAIDVSILNIADPLLRFQVFTTGKIIFYKEIKQYYFEKAKSFSLYQDYQYLLDFFYNNTKKQLGMS